MEKEVRCFDPARTKKYAWAYLLSTLAFHLFFMLTLYGASMIAFIFFVGDHSLYTLFMLALFATDETLPPVVCNTSMILVFVELGVILFLIPACVIAIWKKKVLPLLILTIIANVITAMPILISLFRGALWINDMVVLYAANIIANAFFSRMLYRQYRAERTAPPRTTAQEALLES